MSLQQLEQPPPYTQDRQSLELPSVPSSNVPPRHLPHLPPMEPSPSLAYNPMNHASHAPPHTGITLQPLRLPSVPLQPPSGAGTTYTLRTTGSEDHTRRSASSMEDPDERMAAEALLGIGKASMPPPAAVVPQDKKSALIDPRLDNHRPAVVPSGYETPLKYYPIEIAQKEADQTQELQEPFLSLLTSSHPWLGGTVNGSITAYAVTKSFSPRFIQSGADLVESTLGAVGRRTGVEDGIRRYLDSRKPSDLERLSSPSKSDAVVASREVSADDEAVSESNGITRKVSGSSVDSLPAYDDENKSPEYEEASAPATRSTFRPTMNRSWSTQLMITTSGLGAALNEASLRSLKFCLNLLRQANAHVHYLLDALKRLLQDYTHGQTASSLENGGRTVQHGEDTEMTDVSHASHEQHASTTLAQRMKQLNDEIWLTFKNVVNSVSRYTGGALPANASMVVRWQLMSVPRRWQHVVSTSQPAGDDAVSSANRMLAFGIEGLDMMDQVSGVVDSTILSADRWLESMGRKRKGDVSEDRQPQALPDKS